MALAATTSHLVREMNHRKRQLNKFTTICQLPVEIFSEILRLDIANYPLDEDRGVTPITRQMTLALVSTFWNDVIQNSPTCWAMICLDRDPVNLFLQRSKAYPLDLVAIASKERPVYLVPGAVMTFMKAVVPHAHRWRSLQVQCHYDTDTDRWLRHTSETLQDLQIKVLQADANFTKHFKMQGKTPLRFLSLSAASLPWDSPRLSSLETLSLLNLNGGFPNLDQLERILTSSPGLATLRFGGWKSPQNDHQTQPLVPLPIHLPSLQVLELSQIPRETWDYLVSNIRSTSLSSYQLSNAEESDFIIPKKGPSTLR